MTTETDIGRLPDIFARIAAEGQIAALRDRNGVYEFDISDGGGTWFVNLDHGTPDLTQSVEHPDAVVQCTPADFIAMTQGEQNIMTAYLQGRIKCSGNLGFALDFRRLLPVPA